MMSSFGTHVSLTHLNVKGLSKKSWKFNYFQDMIIKTTFLNIYSRNPRVPCKASILPKMDLSKWIEFPIPNVESAPVVSNNFADDFEVYFKKK